MLNIGCIMRKSLKSKISYHAVYEDSLIDAIRFARENGFTGVQIPVELPYMSFENFSETDIEEIRMLKHELGIRINLHAHDETASLWEANRYLREGIYKYFRALLDFAKKVDAQLITIHVGSRPRYGTDTTPQRLLPARAEKHYIESLRQNLDFLISENNRPTTICVENYGFDTSVAEILEPFLQNGDIFLCWDIAKSFDNELKINHEMENYFRRNAKFIKQVHIHDKADDGCSHLVIGNGGIDFEDYLKFLQNYDILDYCIEVRPSSQAKKSLERLLTLF